MTRPAVSIDSARAAAILDERTARLAAGREDGAGEAQDLLKAAIVVSTGEPFRMIAAVLPGRPLHAIPVRDDAVIGAVHERGEIWIVFSLAALAGTAGTEGSSGRIILLRRRGHRAAIRVDVVVSTVALDRNVLSEITTEAEAAHAAIIRFATPDGLVVLDEAALSERLERPRRSPS